MSIFAGLIIPGVLRLNIQPGPSAGIIITQYDQLAFPCFRPLFETPSASSPLRHLARDPTEASVAVVLENRSQKAVTGLRYRLVMTDESGQQRTQEFSGDSYGTGVYRAMTEPGSRQLITPSGSIDEALMDHVRAGGGLIEMRGSAEPLGRIVEMTFRIDFVLFADGEIAGPDPDRYAAELQCRRPAAEFIAKQIRMAITEERDVTPILSALAEIPCFGRLGHVQGDPLVHWTRRYAQEYLHAMRQKIGTFDTREARLRQLENQQALPKFYRQA